MHKKLVYSTLGFILLSSLILSHQSVALTGAQNQNFAATQSEIFNLINGTNAYDYDLKLERIALNQSIGYSFRSSGSSGADAAANWIEGQFESFGLDTHTESFEFMTWNSTSQSVQPTTWNLTAKPTLTVDDDGDLNTTGDQTSIQSFLCEQYSLPTPVGGVGANLVTLPLPNASSLVTLRHMESDPVAWSAINTTGKVLVIGREVTWMLNGGIIFRSKLLAEPPAAVIFTWSYDWISWAQPLLLSFGGRPGSTSGPYFWQENIPVGWVDYSDGQFLLKEAAKKNASAVVNVQATIGSGPHINVIAKLTGSTHPEKMIIVSSHYDTVMDAGFCDNGAGTAGVLELARVLSDAERRNLYKPDYTILFITFTGEELDSVGAVDYMKQHAAELKNIVAVINLDCIGTGNLEISETFPDDNGLDLQSIVTKSAQDMGLNVTVIEPGGSDQEAFRNPVQTDDDYNTYWGVGSGVRNATRVKSSIMLSVSPLFVTDKFGAAGSPGWIHSPYDNSTTWVTPDKLESHIGVAGLTILRVQSTLLNPLPSEIYFTTAIVLLIALAVAYFERSRLKPFKNKVVGKIRAHIGSREFIYVVILTVILMFVSFGVHIRLGRTEIIFQNHPVGINIQYFGAPFEMIGVPIPTAAAVTQTESGLPQLGSSITGGVQLLWTGLLVNLALCALLAFALTYVAAEIKYRVEYPKN